MSTPRRVIWLWSTIFVLSLGLWGCGEQQSAEESAAPDAIEESAEAVEEAVEEAADTVADAVEETVEEAADTVADAAEDAVEAVADAADGAGSCNYTMQNMFAGPYKVCSGPLDAGACTARGEEDDNSDAVHNAGACSPEGSVGSCVTADGAVVYYEGDPGGLEIGCGFQGGTWESAE